MYRIRTAAERAGVSTELLRAWERRYRLVEPVRTEGGYRVYTDEDVEIVRGAKLLVDGGLSIAQVSQLPRERLRAAARNDDATLRVVAPEGDGGRLDFVDSALTAIAAFDGDAFERVLYRAMGMGALSAREICERVLLPLLRAIGDRWESGKLSVAAEHFGSAIIRAKLLSLIASETRRHPNAQAVVCACLENEEHEGALLAFAVHAAGLGLRVIYLGANTPASEVFATATRMEARYVALSMTATLAAADLARLGAAVTAWLPGRAGRVVIAGGKGALEARTELAGAGIQVADKATAALIFA